MIITTEKFSFRVELKLISALKGTGCEAYRESVVNFYYVNLSKAEISFITNIIIIIIISLADDPPSLLC